LALPRGGVIRFRYNQNLVSDAAKRCLLNAIGRPAFMCYLDISVPGAPATFVPVRRAVVTSAVKEGTSHIIYMQAQEFVRPAAKSVLEKQCTDALPTWGQRDDSGRYPIGGFWVNELRGSVDRALLAAANDMEAFEATISNLLTHDDFKKPENRFFFHLKGVRKVGRTNKPAEKYIDLTSGAVRLGAFERYQVEVYHYFPDEGHDVQRPTHWLGVRSAGRGVTIDGSTLEKADSEYDIKTFHITGARLSIGVHDAIELFRTTDPKNDAGSTADIRLPVYAGPSILVLAAQILLFGLVLALPVVISALPKDVAWSFSDIASWRNFFVYLAAVAASSVAILGLKRPF